MQVAEFIDAQQVDAAVAGDRAGQGALVGGLDEFVDERGGGDIPHGAAVVAGGHPERDEQVGLAGAGVAEQHDGFAAVDPAAGRERGDRGRLDARGGGR